MSPEPAGDPQTESPTDRLLRLERIFHQVTDAAEAERPRLIERLCAGDENLRAELLELLGADSSVGELLAAVPREPDEEGDDDPWIGRMAGSFRLRKVLGRGGMGVVYLGERSAAKASDVDAPKDTGAPAAAAPTGTHDTGKREKEAGVDAPARQRVAVKFVRRSLRGSPALAHFNLERDALAALEHPHIARLIDAGVTDESIPFVIMEYVSGERLDAVADDPATTVREVVALLIQLSDAVAYVHRHLILHRDLKPGNVMVTGDRQVKLLDFGTLKMLGPDAVESAMTQAGMRPVTLRYASPEHIRGGAVSTASEVYSLGMILYRLFAGRLPDGLEGLPLPEYLERLAEGRVPPPSALATKPVERELARDLDAIALKAMRFEPEQRYATADAFAAELRRALEKQPVEARGDSWRYRAGKFYQRNRVTLWAGLATAVVLLGGILATARQARTAREQAHLAERGVEGERRLAHLLLFDYFQKLAAIPGSTDAERRAVSDAIGYLNGLAGTPAGHATTLELDEVQAYTSMGGLLGSPYQANLGDPRSAVAALEKGEAVAHELSLRMPDDIAALRAEGALEQMLANVYFGDGKAADAQRHMRLATAFGDRLVANPAATAADFGQAASMEDGLGDVVGAKDMVGTAQDVDPAPLYQRSLEFDRRGLAKDTGCSRCRRGISVELYKLGLNNEDNDPRRAAEFYRQALAEFATGTAREQAAAASARLAVLVRQRLGMVDVRTGDAAEGLALLMETQRRMQAAVDADPIDTQARFDLAAMESNIADAYAEANDKAHAVEEGRAMVRNMDLLLRTDPHSKVWQIHRAAGAYRLGEHLIESGDRAGGLAQIAAVQPFLTHEAEAADATGFVLAAAVEAMNEVGADPQETLRLARKIAVPPEAPTVEDLRDLAESAARAGDDTRARDAAQRLVALVAAQHLTGPSNEDAVKFAQGMLARR